MSNTSDLLTREEYQAIADKMSFPSNAHINGKFTAAKSGETFETVNPATGEVMTEDFDPLSIPRDERQDYSYEGPEIIYAFWAKHALVIFLSFSPLNAISEKPLIY